MLSVSSACIQKSSPYMSEPTLEKQKIEKELNLEFCAEKNQLDHRNKIGINQEITKYLKIFQSTFLIHSVILLE